MQTTDAMLRLQEAEERKKALELQRAQRLAADQVDILLTQLKDWNVARDPARYNALTSQLHTLGRPLGVQWQLPTWDERADREWSQWTNEKQTQLMGLKGVYEEDIPGYLDSMIGEGVSLFGLDFINGRLKDLQVQNMLQGGGQQGQPMPGQASPPSPDGQPATPPGGQAAQEGQAAAMLPAPEPQILNWNSWVHKNWRGFINVEDTSASMINALGKAVQTPLALPILAQGREGKAVIRQAGRQMGLTDEQIFDQEGNLMPEAAKAIQGELDRQLDERNFRMQESRNKLMMEAINRYPAGDPNRAGAIITAGYQPGTTQFDTFMNMPSMNAEDAAKIKQAQDELTADKERWARHDAIYEQSVTNTKDYHDQMIEIDEERNRINWDKMDKATKDSAGGLSASQARLYAQNVQGLQERNNYLKSQLKTPMNKDKETPQGHAAKIEGIKKAIGDNSNMIRFYNGILSKGGYPIPGQEKSTPGGAAPAKTAPAGKGSNVQVNTAAVKGLLGANAGRTVVLKDGTKLSLEAFVTQSLQSGDSPESVEKWLRSQGYIR
jgi:hypothetical protein